LVNAIAPGAKTPGRSATMDVEMTREHVEAITKAFVTQIPLRQQGEPDDIAKAVLFFASEASNYIVRATIVSDGSYLVG
jgi:3-oxoacyl-[acyl-carrier protein] reductase